MAMRRFSFRTESLLRSVASSSSSDQTRGHGLVLFDTEDHARAAADVVRQGPPGDAPIKVRSVDTFEVMAEA